MFAFSNGARTLTHRMQNTNIYNYEIFTLLWFAWLREEIEKREKCEREYEKREKYEKYSRFERLFGLREREEK
jgi:hypothetical protein